MTPIVLEYLRRYPEMTVDIVTEGRLVDIVVDGFDAGVRLAESVPQDMIAVPLGPDQRFAVVGAPSYFAERRKPCTPQDLRAHRCIRSRQPSGSIYRWEFERRGEALAVDVDGPLTLDDPWLMLERRGRASASLTSRNGTSLPISRRAGWCASSRIGRRRFPGSAFTTLAGGTFPAASARSSS
jgi:DNA-binding transcriptional LysR family regulator